MLEELGDFGVKIKDIIKEGLGSNLLNVVKGFGSGLKPQIFQDIKQTKPGPEMSDLEAAQAAYEKFGNAPPRDKDSPYGWATGASSWLSDEQLKARQDAAKEKSLQNKEAAKKLAKQMKQQTKAKTQQPASPMASPAAAASNIPKGHRIAVTNPQGNATFYKYPDGRWTDEFGNAMPSGAHGALNQFADAAGRMEPIPASTGGYKARGSRSGT